MNIGPMEIAVILILALIILGPKRLPQAGRSIGQAVRELKKATAAARNDLGIDDVAADVKDLKSSLKVGLDDVTADVKEVKSNLNINLSDAEKPASPVVAAAAPAASRRPRTWQTKPGASDQAGEAPEATAENRRPRTWQTKAVAVDEPAQTAQPDTDDQAHEAAGPTADAPIEAPVAAAEADDVELADESGMPEIDATPEADQPQDVIAEPEELPDAVEPALADEQAAVTASPTAAG